MAGSTPVSGLSACRSCCVSPGQVWRAANLPCVVLYHLLSLSLPLAAPVRCLPCYQISIPMCAVYDMDHKWNATRKSKDEVRR